MPEHVGGPARAQQLAVIDAVRAQRHRRQQRHHLRALVARPDTVAKIDAFIDEFLDPEPPRERRDDEDPSVRDRALIVEHDRDAIQSDRLVNMHHKVTSCRRPRPRQSVAFLLLRRSFFAYDRTERPPNRGGSRLRRGCRINREPGA